MKEDIKSFPGLTDQHPLFSISMAGISYCDGSYEITRTDSNLIVLEYVRRGEGTILHNNQRYTAREGDVYLLHRHSSHRYFSDAANPWTKVWFNLHGTVPQSLIDCYGLSDQVVIPGCGEEIGRLFDGFLSCVCQEKAPEDLFREGALWTHRIIMALAEKNAGRRTEAEKRADQIRSYINGRIDRSLTIENVCRQFALSRSVLFHIFKAAFGITPYEYYQQKKLDMAKNLLKNSVMNIREIAQTLEFADQHYFSGWFKKFEGISPNEYRKRAEKKEEP